MTAARSAAATLLMLALGGCTLAPAGEDQASNVGSVTMAPLMQAQTSPAASLAAFSPKYVTAVPHPRPSLSVPAVAAPLHLGYRSLAGGGEIGFHGRLPAPRFGWFTRSQLELGAAVQGREQRLDARAAARLRLTHEPGNQRWRAGLELGSALRSRPALRAHWTRRHDAGAFGTLTGGVLVASAALPNLPFERAPAANAFNGFWQPVLARAGRTALMIGRLAWQAHSHWPLSGGSRLRPGLAVDFGDTGTHASLTLGVDTTLGRWSLGIEHDADGQPQAGLRYLGAL